MDDEELNQDKILIDSDYPHQILMHMRKILKQKKRDFLLQESLFLMEFQKTYPGEPEEYKILQNGYRTGVISDFATHDLETKWKKRVFVQKALFLLQKNMRECDAVALLESLMNIFQWDFTVEVKRRWKAAPQDQANFHAFQKPEQARRDNSFREESLTRERKYHREQYRKESLRRSPRKQQGLPGESQADTMPSPSPKNAAVSRQEGNNNLSHKKVEEVVHILKEDQTEKINNIFILEEGRTITSPQEVKHYSKMSLSDRKQIKKAIAGNEKSQCYLGDFYSEENSGHLDYPEAVYWYQLSANQGNYRARMQLATIYDGNLLKGKDTKHRGIQCFRQLADEGFPTAQCILGMKYFFGDGVEENRQIAVKWLKKAAAQGHDEAVKLLERFMT